MSDVPERMIRQEHLSIVICGLVNSGESTTTGRPLLEMGSIPERELDNVTQEEERLEKSSFAIAFNVDRQDEEEKRGEIIACNTEKTMEERKETFQGMMENDGEQTQCAAAKSRANSTSDKEVDLWMKVCEQGYLRYPGTASLFPGNSAHVCDGARGSDYRLRCHGLHREGGFH